MAIYYRGETVIDYFTIIDVDSVVVEGAAIVIDTVLDPDGLSFDLTIAEIGDGVYSASFEAEKAGEYYYRVHTDDTDPPQYFEASIDIDVRTQAVLVGGSDSTQGTTLYEILRMVAVEMGDFKEIVATGDGSEDGTSFIDARRLPAQPAQAFKGADLLVVAPVGGPNYWQGSRVLDSSPTGVLSLTPALPNQVTEGDTAWLSNIKSRGWDFLDYTNAINAVLQKAFPNHVVPATYTYGSTLSTSTLDFPTDMTHLTRIEGWVDDEYVRVIPRAVQNIPGKPGWAYDYSSGKIVFSGGYAEMYHGHYVRLIGYTREGILTNPEDMTTVDLSWLIPSVAAMMTRGMRDQKTLTGASMSQNIADMNLVSAVTQFDEGTIRIR